MSINKLSMSDVEFTRDAADGNTLSLPKCIKKN